MSLEHFLNDHYRRHNQRRQEHLATLGLPLAGRSVVEVGAGIGDHTSFFLDRGCRVTPTEVRPENIAYLARRFPQLSPEVWDLDADGPVQVPPHDIVYAYGILYHLQDPAGALERMASVAKELLLLETCVSYGEEASVNLVQEAVEDLTQAAHGVGCRPTRPWVFATLKQHFPFAYVTRSQPWHEEFPVEWRDPSQRIPGLVRSVFVGSRQSLSCDSLSEVLLDRQIRA